MIFKNTGFVIGHVLKAKGFYFCAGVLRHVQAIFVIYIHQRKGVFCQEIKEKFFCIAIGGKTAVIVEMIVGEVGKNPAAKMQSKSAHLHHGM